MLQTISGPGVAAAPGLVRARVMRALCAVLVLAGLLCAMGVRPAAAADAAWPSFRADAANNGVTAAPTPTGAAQTSLRWAVSFGDDWSASPSPQIVVGNTLFTVSGTTLYKLDQATGNVLATAPLAGSTSFGYTAPTYAEGMIFVPLGDGKIQAIDADTMTSLWVYTDPAGGQNWVAPTYAGGYVYGGFLASGAETAHFVCLRAADEDPTTGTEAKQAEWSYAVDGGFYWTGAVSVGPAIVVGTEAAGESGSAHLVSLDKASGKVISQLEVAGNQRSSIVASGGAVYFTTTAGYLYRAQANPVTGALSALTSVKVGSYCTSTPVIYGGRAYVGTSEGGSGTLAVVDVSDMSRCYSVELPAACQSSPVMSTAYLASTGKLYVYVTLNAEPGGMQLITLPPDASSAADAQVQQIYDAAGHEQYCMTSPAVAADGTLFYKNDSGYIFALAPVRTSAESASSSTEEEEKEPSGSPTLPSDQGEPSEPGAGSGTDAATGAAGGTGLAAATSAASSATDSSAASAEAAESTGAADLPALPQNSPSIPWGWLALALAAAAALAALGVYAWRRRQAMDGQAPDAGARRDR